METTATAAVWMTFAAMALSPSAAVAHAEPYYSFQSPSGNVYCGLGQAEDQSGDTTFAVCEIRDHTWAAQPRPTPRMGGWGDRISMRQGGAPQMSCHQTRSLNSLMCNSETSGMTCVDNGTGHYFRLARDNYELH
jgi:hypothetical protein